MEIMRLQAASAITAVVDGAVAGSASLFHRIGKSRKAVDAPAARH